MRSLLGVTLLGSYLLWGVTAWGQVLSIENVPTPRQIQAMTKDVPKFSGGVAASFGNIAVGSTLSGESEASTTNAYFTAVQSDLILTGGRDFAYYVGLRVRGAQYSFVSSEAPIPAASVSTEGGRNDATDGDVFVTGGLHSVRVRLSWRATEFLLVSVGRLPGIGGTGFADIQPAHAPVRSDGVNQFALHDLGAIDFRFQLPIGLVIGTSLSSSCTPRCDRNARGEEFPVHAQQTILSYFSYVGKIFKAGYRNASAFGSRTSPGGISLVTDSSVETEASGSVAELALDFGSLYLGVESSKSNPSRVVGIGTSSAAAFIRSGAGVTRDKNIPEKIDQAIAVKLSLSNWEVYLQQVTETTTSGRSGVLLEEISFTNIGLLRKFPHGTYGFETTNKVITPYSITGEKNPGITWSTLRFLISMSL